MWTLPRDDPGDLTRVWPGSGGRMLAAGVVALLCACSGPKEMTAPDVVGDLSTDGAPVILPVAEATGLVTKVHERLRFVVIDYALQELPGQGQILYLYRQGQRVARLKVSGPVMGQSLVADIVEGAAAVGDEARID